MKKYITRLEGEAIEYQQQIQEFKSELNQLQVTKNTKQKAKVTFDSEVIEHSDNISSSNKVIENSKMSFVGV